MDWCEAPLKDGSGTAKSIRALREELQRRGLLPVKSASVETPAVADSAEEDVDDSVGGLLDAEIEDQSSRSVSCSIDLGTTPLELSPPSLDYLRDQYIQGMRSLIEKESPPEERVSFIRILLEKEWAHIQRSIEEGRDASASPEPSL